MFAFYNNTPDRGLVYNFGNEEPMIKAPTPEHTRKLAEYDAKLRAARDHWNSVQPELNASQRAWEKTLAKPVWWNIEGGQVLHVPFSNEGERTGRAFDGKDSYDAGKGANFDFQDPYTLSAWIRPEAPDGAILSRADDYWEGAGYMLLLKNGKVRLHEGLRYTDISLRLETEQAVPMNEWTHVTLTYDGYRKAKGVHIYFNGVEQKIKVEFDELTYNFAAERQFRVGAGGGLRFRGLIDDVRVYNVPLTAREVATLPLRDSITQLAAIPEAQRTEAQHDKLTFCFLDRFAPTELREARNHLLAAEKARRLYYDSIPTVMVMVEGPHPPGLHPQARRLRRARRSRHPGRPRSAAAHEARVAE